MPQIWLNFFDRFLKQPVFYKPGESIRQRQRGVPISHALSYLFSELLLFGMDLYIYQSTGIFTYRFHDDFWFFDSQLNKVKQAWALMNEYAQRTGLKFNNEKCGSVQIRSANMINHSEQSFVNVLLPQNSVKWGLLKLQTNGRFVIDQNGIQPFINEMKTRLTNAVTILEWVNLYNEYMAFFMRNFGRSTNILGTFHTEQIIKTLQFIHQYVFEETKGNALTVLKNRIQEQFPNCVTDEIFEGWLYWPLMQGGLGLKNVYLDLYSVHNQLLISKEITFAQLPVEDLRIYTKLKEEYEQSKKDPFEKFHPESSYRFIQKYVQDHRRFMTYDEFISRRLTHLVYWRDVYRTMLDLTKPLLPKKTYTFEKQPNTFDRCTSISSDIYDQQQDQTNDSYMQWLICYYGEQIQAIFQQLDFIDSDSIPIGLVKMIKTADIDWNKLAN